MSNLITLPFKTTQAIPLKNAVRNYIQNQHSETHPNAFRSDINKWESLRKDATANVVHTSSVDKLIAYQAQLTFISTKLPPDIDLPIPYSCPFPPNPSPPMLTMPNLIYEKINVLYNLAALYCNLAVSENRSNSEGIKRSLGYFQNASGVLSHIVSMIPSLIESLPPNTPLPVGLSVAFHNALHHLMLAQAHELFWQAAVFDNKVAITLISKLAAKTASCYGRTLEAMEDPQATSAFPRDWILHVRIKQCHFVAAALYRKSIDDLGGNRYGEEIARLEMAKAEAKKGLDAARRGNVTKAVVDDIKSLFSTAEASLKRAERDNDLIYHQVVPSSTSLPTIPDMKDLVSANIPQGLLDPKLVVAEGDAIFAELSGWGVLKAIDIYNTRRNDWLQSEIFQPAKDLDVAAQTTLQALNLPASLDALDKPVGLPPSLLSKAEQVRREGGMIRVSKLLDSFKALDAQNRAALDNALDILDQEASEDEEMRAAYKNDIWTRPPSYQVNTHLTDAANRYQDILDSTENKRRELHTTADAWSKNIEALCWDIEALESAVPSSTGATNGGSKMTQAHARALRSFLETLEDIIQERAGIISKAQWLSSTDDVSSKFKREESSLSRYAEVRPEAFDEAIEKALGKYDAFKAELEENERRQNEALDEIKEKNVLFLESRRECPSVKARESVLQDLDLAYHKYCTLCQELLEGIKLHNDLSALIAELEDSCKTWVLERRKDIEWLTGSLNATTLSASKEEHAATGLATPNKAPSIVRQYSELSFDIPPPNSSAWDTLSPNGTPYAHKSDFAKTPLMTKKDLNRPSQPKDRATNSDFALDLPPPNSSAWESISPKPMLSPSGFSPTKTRKTPR